MVNLEIDGKPVQIEPGRMIIEAASKLGIAVPHFCYHKKLSIAANCRMCLVQVEKAPKPLPACATPVAEGMKVMTHSENAIKAQKGVMEFLLINHPLDCPICDQGGECQLQDLAVGYGASRSRYAEDKRVVANKALGPLISTDMTRCIHCTRCVRFGREVAGVMELGMIGRGEHAEIIQFIGTTIDSELSGNMIDVCPVGALTSKPFRYTARTWELTRYRCVSPHDALGSNLIVQVKNNRVMRVLPRENEAVNECWLSDRDRFSYEGLNSDERLTQPMVRENGTWRATDWQTALELTASRLKQIASQHGPEAIGALTTAQQTLEEMYLLQALMRGIGSDNIDHRLRQSDFSVDGIQAGAPWFGMAIADVPALQSVLLIGSSLRAEQPLLTHRLRQAVKKGAHVSVINPLDEDLLMRVSSKLIVVPDAMRHALAKVLRAVEEKQGGLTAEVQSAIAGVQLTDPAREIAASLFGKERAAIWIGALAQQHPHYGQILLLAQELARVTGAKLGVLPEGANAVGAYVVGALPFAGPKRSHANRGLTAKQMLESPRKAYVLMGAEVEADCYDPHSAVKAMGAADFVVALSSYRALDYAHVLLPISPFTETSGTFINMEGRAQSFNGVVRPLGEARPAWKVLRVLAELLGVEGVAFDSVEAIREALAADLPGTVTAMLDNGVTGLRVTPVTYRAGNGLQRIGDVPMYRTDAIVRRATSLQQTRANAAPTAAMNAATLQRLGLADGGTAKVVQNGSAASFAVTCDKRLPDGAVRLPAGHGSTSKLGGQFDAITVERGGP